MKTELLLLIYVLASNLLTILIAKRSINRIKDLVLVMVIDSLKLFLRNWWAKQSLWSKFKLIITYFIAAFSVIPVILFPSLVVSSFVPDQKIKEWFIKIYTSATKANSQRQSPVVKSADDEPEFEPPF